MHQDKRKTVVRANCSTNYDVDRAPICLGDVEICGNDCHEIGMMISFYKIANAIWQ